MTTNNNRVKTNSEHLEEILHELTTHNQIILSAIIVSDEGLNVASGIPHPEDDTLALSTSDLVDMAEEYSRKLEQGGLTSIVMEGERRTTIILRSSRRTILVVLVPADTKLGVLMMSMRRAAEKIATLFS